MEKEEKIKIIEQTASMLGRERSHHLLVECSIDMASALLQREAAMSDGSPDPDLIDSLDRGVDGRLADLLVAIDVVCQHGRRRNVRDEIQKRMVHLDVQNLSAELP